MPAGTQQDTDTPSLYLPLQGIGYGTAIHVLHEMFHTLRPALNTDPERATGRRSRRPCLDTRPCGIEQPSHSQHMRVCTYSQDRSPRLTAQIGTGTHHVVMEVHIEVALHWQRLKQELLVVLLLRSMAHDDCDARVILERPARQAQHLQQFGHWEVLTPEAR